MSDAMGMGVFFHVRLPRTQRTCARRRAKAIFRNQLMLCFPAATSKCAEYKWRERSMFNLDNSQVVLPLLLLFICLYDIGEVLVSVCRGIRVEYPLRVYIKKCLFILLQERHMWLYRWRLLEDHVLHHVDGEWNLLLNTIRHGRQWTPFDRHSESEIASKNSHLVLMTYPSSASGRAVSQIEVPFNWARSLAQICSADMVDRRSSSWTLYLSSLS
jgi:hypothetical protein